MVTGLAVDMQGNVYVGTASTGTEHHGVWRITPAAEATHIPGTEAIGMPPNRLAFDNRGNLFVANTERGHIVQIPVLPDGAPGTASIVASGHDLLFIDGLTVDVQGILYAANVVKNTMVAVNRFSNEQKVLAIEEDGLDGPASLTFGAGPEKVDILYITNFGLLSPDSHPGVLRMDLDWPVR